jgi:hypothetical protein
MAADDSGNSGGRPSAAGPSGCTDSAAAATDGLNTGPAQEPGSQDEPASGAAANADASNERVGTASEKGTVGALPAEPGAAAVPGELTALSVSESCEVQPSAAVLPLSSSAVDAAFQSDGDGDTSGGDSESSSSLTGDGTEVSGDEMLVLTASDDPSADDRASGAISSRADGDNAERRGFDALVDDDSDFDTIDEAAEMISELGESEGLSEGFALDAPFCDGVQVISW